MNTTEYIRQRGWDEDEINSKVFSSSKGKPVTARFMMEAYADYRVEQALSVSNNEAENEIDASDAPEANHDAYADVRNLECEADHTEDLEQTSSAALETRIDSGNESDHVCTRWIKLDTKKVCPECNKMEELS